MSLIRYPDGTFRKLRSVPVPLAPGQTDQVPVHASYRVWNQGDPVWAWDGTTKDWQPATITRVVGEDEYHVELEAGGGVRSGVKHQDLSAWDGGRKPRADVTAGQRSMGRSFVGKRGVNWKEFADYHAEGGGPPIDPNKLKAVESSVVQQVKQALSQPHGPTDDYSDFVYMVVDAMQRVGIDVPEFIAEQATEEIWNAHPEIKDEGTDLSQYGH